MIASFARSGAPLLSARTIRTDENVRRFFESAGIKKLRSVQVHPAHELDGPVLEQLRNNRIGNRLIGFHD